MKYARKRRVKLGVPKKILEYFQYHTPAAKQEILLSDIVDAIPDNEPELQDSIFHGRDKYISNCIENTSFIRKIQNLLATIY